MARRIPDGTFTSGSVGLLNPLNPNQYVIIATGGSRGDFISPDTSDGSLFLSYQDQVVRLSLADPAVSPEPASVGLFGIGCLAMGLMYRRRHA